VNNIKIDNNRRTITRKLDAYTIQARIPIIVDGQKYIYWHYYHKDTGCENWSITKGYKSFYSNMLQDISKFLEEKVEEEFYDLI